MLTIRYDKVLAAEDDKKNPVQISERRGENVKHYSPVEILLMAGGSADLTQIRKAIK